jgi:hypothetical protein
MSQACRNRTLTSSDLGTTEALERISWSSGWENAPALTGEAVAFSASWSGLLDALSSAFVAISW